MASGLLGLGGPLALGPLGLRRGPGLGLGGAQRLGGGLALGGAFDPDDGEQVGDRLGGLSALGDPAAGLVGVDLDPRGLVGGVVEADVLDETAVTGAARVGDHDAIVGRLLHAHAHKADLHGHRMNVLLLGVARPPGRVCPPPSLPWWRPGLLECTGCQRPSPIRRRRLGFMPASWRIMRRAWSNCLRTALTCWVVVPEPRATRARREPLRILGLLRSAGVIERMIASIRARSRSSTSTSFSSRLIPGSMPMIWLSGPSFLTCCSWSRKSSRVKEASRSLRCMRS